MAQDGRGAPGTLGDVLKKDEPHCILIEPKLLRSGVFVPIPTARETGYMAARFVHGQIKPYTRSEFRKLRIPWKEFFKKGKAAAARHLEAMKPAYYRDTNKTITHCIVETASPLTASTILTSEFFERFEPAMGPKFYVAVPDRNTVFIFPKSNQSLGGLQDIVIDTYKVANYPASLELFELSEDGIRVIGKFGKT